jgi:hypothetical protein
MQGVTGIANGIIKSLTAAQAAAERLSLRLQGRKTLLEAARGLQRHPRAPARRSLRRCCLPAGSTSPRRTRRKTIACSRSGARGGAPDFFDLNEGPIMARVVAPFDGVPDGEVQPKIVHAIGDDRDRRPWPLVALNAGLGNGRGGSANRSQALALEVSPAAGRSKRSSQSSNAQPSILNRVRALLTQTARRARPIIATLWSAAMWLPTERTSPRRARSRSRSGTPGRRSNLEAGDDSLRRRADHLHQGRAGALPRS